MKKNIKWFFTLLVLITVSSCANSSREFAEAGSHGVLFLVAAGIGAISDTAKKAKADERDTLNIKLNYEFFPGAEYEIRFVKSKSKNGPYAEVEVIPKKGYPRGQTRGRGAVPSYDDIKAAAAAEEAAKTAAGLPFRRLLSKALFY